MLENQRRTRSDKKRGENGKEEKEEAEKREEKLGGRRQTVIHFFIHQKLLTTIQN
jgi:hypothetical protein